MVTISIKSDRVRDPDRTIVIELDHERYDRLIVEVEDPPREEAKIERALKKRG